MFSSETKPVLGQSRLSWLIALRTSSGSSPPSGVFSSACMVTPARAERPPASPRFIWVFRPTMTESPRAHWERMATMLPWVPLVTRTASSLPSRSAAIASSRFTVGSSPSSASPSSASAIATRISVLGRVLVSLRRSTVLMSLSVDARLSSRCVFVRLTHIIRPSSSRKGM